MTANGWHFNGDAGTQTMNDPRRQYASLFMTFEEMDMPLLNVMLVKLTGDDVDKWKDQIREIRTELANRTPPKIITSITIKSNL